MKRIILAIALIAASLSLSAAETTQTATPAHGSFAWGVEAGAGIDMGGDDMSSLNLHASLGYRYRWLQFVGVGAGIDVMMSNSCRSFPVYAMFRTSFSEKPKLLFGDLRVGIAYNETTGLPNKTDFYIKPGIGIVLAHGSKFSSHLLLSYSYNSMSFYGDRENSIVKGLNRITIGIGATF